MACVGLRGSLRGPRQRRGRPGIRLGELGPVGRLSKAHWAGFRARSGPWEGSRPLEEEPARSAGPSYLTRLWGEDVSFGAYPI